MTRKIIRPNFRRLQRDEGQGMTEYIINVALIAIAAIGVVTIFGQNIRALFGASTASLAGDTNVNANTKNGNRQQYTGTKSLKNFGQSNQ